MEDLAISFGNAFNNIQYIEIGNDLSDDPIKPIDPNNDDWIYIPTQKIKLDSGEDIIVKEFTISKFPIPTAYMDCAWTNTKVAENIVVARDRRTKYEYPTSYYELLLGFRTCKIK